MKKTLQYLLIACLLTTYIFTGSCIGDNDETEIVELLQTWILQSFGKIGEEPPLILDTEITIQFNEENRVEGFSGCNQYFGQYRAKDDGTLSFRDLAMTEMACLRPEGVMIIEQRYLDALADVSAYEVEENRLRLFYDEGQSVLNYTVKQ